jgi:hypothetical protein
LDDSDPFRQGEGIYLPQNQEAMTGRTTHCDQIFSDHVLAPDYTDLWGGTCMVDNDITEENVAGPAPMIVTNPD